MDDYRNQPIPETIRETVERVLEHIPHYPTNLAISGIYAITCQVTQQVYVGSSKNIYSRLTTHIKMLHASKHHSYKLQRVYNAHKLGNFTFVILEEVPDITTLFAREQHYMDIHAKKRGKLLNVSKRADGSDYLKRKRKRKTTKKKVKTSGKT